MKTSDCELPILGILNEKLKYFYISEKFSFKLLGKVFLMQLRKMGSVHWQI